MSPNSAGTYTLNLQMQNDKKKSSEERKRRHKPALTLTSGLFGKAAKEVQTARKLSSNSSTLSNKNSFNEETRSLGSTQEQPSAITPRVVSNTSKKLFRSGKSTFSRGLSSKEKPKRSEPEECPYQSVPKKTSKEKHIFRLEAESPNSLLGRRHSNYFGRTIFPYVNKGPNPVNSGASTSRINESHELSHLNQNSSSHSILPPRPGDLLDGSYLNSTNLGSNMSKRFNPDKPLFPAPKLKSPKIAMNRQSKVFKESHDSFHSGERRSLSG